MGMDYNLYIPIPYFRGWTSTHPSGLSFTRGTSGNGFTNGAMMPCTEFWTGKPPCPVKSPTWCSLETSASPSRSWLRRGIQGGQGLSERCHKSRKGRNPYGGFVKLGAPKSSKIRQFYHWIPSFGSLFWTIDLVRYEHHDKTLACWGAIPSLGLHQGSKRKASTWTKRLGPADLQWQGMCCGSPGSNIVMTSFRIPTKRTPPVIGFETQLKI